MKLAKVRDKYQLTIPEKLRHQINVAVGDYVELDVQDGALVIRPVKVLRKERESTLQTLREVWKKMERANGKDVERLTEEAFRQVRRTRKALEI